MYRFLFSLFFSFIFLSIINGQELAPCGTLDYKSKWLKNFQENINNLRSTDPDSLIYVPISVHIVGTDAGVGYFPLESFHNSFCQLNYDFEPSNIQFFVYGDIHYINNSNWYNHETVLDGAEMMFANNIDSTFNCYILSDPAGNCGYNLPYAGIALAKSCITGTKNTWAHELGHGFHLPHPFLGWEGDDYDYDSPTPTEVYYDYTYFKDTLILDTLIIDTALVELMDGSNCLIAADGFCDTPPDYLSHRWFCNDDNESITLQKDPNNIDFRSDGSLYMAYPTDECQSRFSDDQIAAMRANIIETKHYLFQDLSAYQPIEDDFSYMFPFEDTLSTNMVELKWNSIENATKYLLKVSRIPTFGQITVDTVINDTSFIIPQEDLLVNKKYYWKIFAYNELDLCGVISETVKFYTSSPTSTIIIDEVNNFEIFPNPIIEGNQLKLSCIDNKNISIDIYNSIGQSIFSDNFYSKNISFYSIDKVLLRGMYFVRIKIDNAIKIFKVEVI